MEAQTKIMVLSSHFLSTWIIKCHQNNALPAPVHLLVFVLNQERAEPHRTVCHMTWWEIGPESYFKVQWLN